MRFDELKRLYAAPRTHRPQHHHEDSLQKACVAWFDHAHPELSIYLHHSPNGGFRWRDEAAKFKAMGVRAGFPDLVLLVPRGKCPFLAIELKYGGNRQSPRQKAYQKALEAIGARYVVVRSLEDFQKIINEYLNSE